MESSASAGRVASAVLDPRRRRALLSGLAWSPTALLAARVVQGAALQTGTALGVAIVTTVAVSAPSAT
jgi:hypothetical protein